MKSILIVMLVELTLTSSQVHAASVFARNSDGDDQMTDQGNGRFKKRGNSCASAGSPCSVQGAVNALVESGTGGTVINQGTVITVSPAGQISVNGPIQ